MIKKTKQYYKRFNASLETQDWRCTMWINGNWVRCCKIHDINSADSYAQKSEAERKESDNELRVCVKKQYKDYGERKRDKLKTFLSEKVHATMGNIMYIGIRSFLNIRKILTGRPKF